MSRQGFEGGDSRTAESGRHAERIEPVRLHYVGCTMSVQPGALGVRAPPGLIPQLSMQSPENEAVVDTGCSGFLTLQTTLVREPVRRP